jgi:(p)ppGpp synthase/HD superfamily hydrolase
VFMSDAPGSLSPRLTEAFDMAREAHNGGSIKGTELPYLLHVLDVCSIALRHGADEDQAIAALLHDAVEDGGGAPKLAEIRVTFGDRVGDIVEACSDSLEVDPTKKAEWWLRKIRYIDHLAVATEDTALVSGADKLSNVRSLIADHAVLGDASFEKFRTGRAGTVWYYCRMVEVLPARLPATDRAQSLGVLLQTAVHELVTAVGEPAADDWREATAQEQCQRSKMTDA